MYIPRRRGSVQYAPDGHHHYSLVMLLMLLMLIIVAIFYPFNQFCEIDIALLSS